MAKSNALEWAKLIGIFAGGFIAYRIGKAAFSAGGDVVGAAKKVITTDLNPLSTENLAYKAVNTVTGGDEAKPLGVRMWEWWNPEKVAAEVAAVAPTKSENISPAIEVSENAKRLASRNRYTTFAEITQTEAPMFDALGNRVN